jgi:hypothetical protein
MLELGPEPVLKIGIIIVSIITDEVNSSIEQVPGRLQVRSV